MNQIKGTLHFIENENRVNDNFTKKEFIVKTDETYPQFIRMEFHNSQIGLLSSFKVGDKVSVDINLRGKLKKDDETKCFITIQAWKISKI